MKHFKAIFRSSLGAAGFEVRRAPDYRRLKAATRKATAGRFIEMVGPSGIGKSTLFGQVSGELAKDWFLPQDLRNLGLTGLDQDPRLMRTHRALLFRRSERLQSGSGDFWVCCGLMRYGAEVIERDLLMRSDLPRGFALDEGLFQCYPSELLGLDEEDWATVCQGRSLVVLEAADPETVSQRALGRIHQRIASGKFQHPTSAEALLQAATRAQLTFEKLAERALLSGVKVLRLNAEADSRENVGKLLRFAQSLGTEDHSKVNASDT